MYLVTGGAGFIGAHLIDQLLARREEVVCLDDFNDFYDPIIKRRHSKAHQEFAHYHLVEGDIRDVEFLDTVFARFKINVIVHLAGRAGVQPSLSQPVLYEDVNVRGTINLLEKARMNRVRQFILASSSSVYGGNTKVPFSENDPIERPVSPYAATKRSAELMCYTYHHLYGINTTCLRFFTVYGPRQRPEMAIHKFVKALFENRPITIFGSGDSARDYTYIGDIVQGLLAAIDRPFDYEVINLGESSPVALRYLVALLEEISGIHAELSFLPFQAGDVEITYADISKAQQLLGYAPSVRIREGLEQFVHWYVTDGKTK